MPEQPLTNVIEFDPEDEYRPEPEPEPTPPNWMDGSLRIGIHTSIAGGHLNALESAHKLGCNALQIFSASPRALIARSYMASANTGGTMKTPRLVGLMR